MRVGSVTALPFENGTFDLVLLSEVLEHIPDDTAALREIVRVLRPGGHLVISVPHPPAPIHDSEHVREGYSIKELTDLLAKCGFEVLVIENCMYGITKAVMRLESWWGARISRFTPAPLYWPLYIERLLPKSLGLGLPYDTVVLAMLRDPDAEISFGSGPEV